MVTKYGTNFYTLDRSEPANTYAALVDDDAFILVGKFDTLATPATTANVYQKGCLMAKTDAAGGVEAVYQNTGTLAVPVWTVLETSNAAFQVVLAGRPTTVGGSATEAFTVTGALTTDQVFVQVYNNGTANVSVLEARITAANTLTVVFSGNPGNDTVIAYQIIRAV